LLSALIKEENMKVLHLIGGGDIGGAKVHVLSLVKELGKKIDVKIVAFRPGVFYEEAQDMGIDIEIVRTGSIITDVLKVKKIIKNGNFQIIHAHGSKGNLVASILKIFCKIPAITTIHSDYRLDYMGSIWRTCTLGFINKIALRFMDYYIAVSNNFKEMLVKRKFNPDRIFILYNGTDFSQPLKNYSKEEFIKKYNIPISGNDMVVGILARLDPVKGLDIFLKGAKLVLEKRPEVKFLIAGEGEQRSNLINLSKKLGISDSVFFLGWVTDPYEFMSNVDIPALTSLSESFSYTILESAMLKKTIVSSDVGGISDLIEHGKNGFLFAPGDYNALSDYIIKLIDSSELRAKMGQKLHEKASSKFSLENMVNTQLDIYNKVQEKYPVR